MVQNFEFLLCLYLGKIGLRIVFGDVLDRKYAFPDYKKIDFIWLPNLIIFHKGL